MTRTVKLNKSHLSEILAIENDSFSNPWTRDMLLAELDKDITGCEGLQVDGRLAGFCLYWVICDEGHVVDIAVNPGDRNKGYGEKILESALRHMKEAGAASVFLELRVSNTSARRLYERAGFKEIYLRRGYYSEDGEDALVMQLILDSERS